MNKQQQSERKKMANRKSETIKLTPEVMEQLHSLACEGNSSPENVIRWLLAAHLTSRTSDINKLRESYYEARSIGQVDF